MKEEIVQPKREYRIIQEGIGYNSYVPQYRNKNKYWNGYCEWKNCTERKHDSRDGEWYDAKITFDTLEKATDFIEKEVEKNTIKIYSKSSWIIR